MLATSSSDEDDYETKPNVSSVRPHQASAFLSTNKNGMGSNNNYYSQPNTPNLSRSNNNSYNTIVNSNIAGVNNISFSNGINN